MELLNRHEKDPEEAPWLQGLVDDLRETGYLRNPVNVHAAHPGRFTGKQPPYLVQGGSNRLWAAEQLGWDTVPVIVSLPHGEFPPCKGTLIHPHQVDEYLGDPGKLVPGRYGLDLVDVSPPEEMYADAVVRDLKATGKHNSRRPRRL